MFDFNTAPDDGNLDISAYNLVRSDHSSNSKRGGVCIYCRNLLHLGLLDIQYLHECINIEMKIGDNLCYIIALYTSPSQLQDEFEKFSKKLELNLHHLVRKNPFLVVLNGEFNARSKMWYKNGKCSFETNTIKIATSKFGQQQVIKEPSHFSDNSSSCIDRIFTSQANLLIESGVHSSLHSSCHHQIIIPNLTCRMFTFLPFCVRYGIIEMQKRRL